jgi:hypothetical protein
MCGDCERLDRLYKKSKATKEEREQDDIQARWHGGHR